LPLFIELSISRLVKVVLHVYVCVSSIDVASFSNSFRQYGIFRLAFYLYEGQLLGILFLDI
jgi:hypothetical protein